MKKILIVEDEVFIADELRSALKEMDYKPLGPISRAEDVLAFCKAEDPDLILMDIHLAGKEDGIYAANIVREELAIPVVFLTAHSDERTLKRASITEPFGYILKPITDLELKTAISFALYRSGPRKPAPLSGSSKAEQPLEAPRELFSKDNTDALREFIDSLPSLSFLNETARRALVMSAKEQQYRPGEILAFEEQEGVDGFIVMEGRVAMKKASDSGKELVVEFLPAGSIFGLAVALAWDPYPVNAVSQSKSKVLWIPREAIKSTLLQYPEYNEQVLRDVFARLRSSHNVSRALAHDRVEVRLVSTLLALLPEHRTSDHYVDTIFITRQELADAAGTTLETTVRVTKALERQELLNLSSRGKITIPSKERLLGLLEENFS